jgi:catechol 2,3-dioxygenase-like lactoylglutathione lyase family enzyme
VPSRVDTITFDCRDPEELARFWCSALGYRVAEVHEGWGIEIADPSGSGLPMLFLTVPEGKVVKNRMHLDIRPPDSMGAEADRLSSEGGSVQRYDDGNWIVMQDPEGNEFCVLQGPEDGWSPQPERSDA